MSRSDDTRLGLRYQITACADGFMSIIDRKDKAKQRRLGAALPAHSVDDIFLAYELVAEVSELRLCAHGGKIGTTLEAHAKHWPLGGTDDVQHLYDLGQRLRDAEVRLTTATKAKGKK